MTTKVMVKVTSRLRVGIQALAAVIAQALPIVDEVIAVMNGTETAKPNPTKVYKPRRLKLDPIHRMARMLYKMRVRNPAFVRKRKLYQKIYRRKNKLLLERRADFVKKARDRMGLDD